MGCIIEFKDPSIRFEFSCQEYKQQILMEILIKYSKLTLSDLASVIGTSVEVLQEVYSGKSFLQEKVALNLSYLLFIFLGG